MFNQKCILTIRIFRLQTFSLDYDHAQNNNGGLFFAGHVQHAIMPIRWHPECPLSIQIKIFFVMCVLSTRRRSSHLPMKKQKQIKRYPELIKFEDGHFDSNLKDNVVKLLDNSCWGDMQDASDTRFIAYKSSLCAERNVPL